MQGRNRDAGIQNGCVDTEGGREDGVNWEIGIDLRAVPCIKQIASGNSELSSVLFGDLEGWEGGPSVCIYIHIYTHTCSWFTFSYNRN